MTETGSTRLPVRAVPDGAVDCHHHVYDPRFPAAKSAVLRPPPAASIDDYRAFKGRLGIARHVVVQPSTYGQDNRCLLAALAVFGRSARGIAVCDRTVSDDTLAAWHTAGVRGLRFNSAIPGGTSIDELPVLAARIAPLGWHVQVVMAAEECARHQSIFQALPCPVVFDHFAHIPQPQGLAHPSFPVICELLTQGPAWIKLSGVYLDSHAGPPDYEDAKPLARALMTAAPDRVLWGSDWPHPTRAPDDWPDDARLLDLLGQWALDDATWHRILVDNPSRLYGFADT